jgi:hypothetical protein
MLTVALVALLAPAGAFAQGLAGTLRSTGGASVPVAGMRGRVVVLMFGGMVDPQSPEELPALERLAARYQGRGVDVYWVSLDPATTADAALVDFAARNGYHGAILRDGGDVLRSAGAGKRPQLPTVVVLDKNGAVAGQPVGGFDRDVDFVATLGAPIDPLLK